MKKQIIILIMMCLSVSVSAQNVILKTGKVVPLHDFYHKITKMEKKELIDAMLHCNNIKALVDTIRSRGEEVYIVFDGYKDNYYCNGEGKWKIFKVSVEDFLYKRKKFNRYADYVNAHYGSKFIINGLEIYKRNIGIDGKFVIGENEKYYMTWLKYNNESEYISRMMREESSNKSRARFKKEQLELKKQLKEDEKKALKEMAEKYNMTLTDFIKNACNEYAKILDKQEK